MQYHPLEEIFAHLMHDAHIRKLALLRAANSEIKQETQELMTEYHAICRNRYMCIDTKMMGEETPHYVWLNEARHSHSYDDQPAIICYDGTREWMYDGKRHRASYLVPIVITAQIAPLGSSIGAGPASASCAGEYWWYYDGKPHRSSSIILAAAAFDKVRGMSNGAGPAFISKERCDWYFCGVRHRSSANMDAIPWGTPDKEAPAIVHGNGKHQWFFKGAQMNFSSIDVLAATSAVGSPSISLFKKDLFAGLITSR